VEWLSERLMMASGMTDSSVTSTEIPPAAVLLLDCRPPADYQAAHIAGAVHLAVPTLMLRRLATGSLPVSSVVSCLQVYDTPRIVLPSVSCCDMVSNIGLVQYSNIGLRPKGLIMVLYGTPGTLVQEACIRKCREFLASNFDASSFKWLIHSEYTVHL